MFVFLHVFTAMLSSTVRWSG